MKPLKRSLCAAVFAVLLLPGPARGVINATLQPVDLYERHHAVLAGEVTAVDAAKGTLVVRVGHVYKGGYKPGQHITVQAEEKMKPLLAQKVREKQLAPGAKWVGFAGKKLRRRENHFMFYTDAGWGLGKMASPTQWAWDESDMEEVGIDGEEVPTLGGTWCGSTAKLIELLADIVAGTAHCPRRAYCRFWPGLRLLELDKPIWGVALYDVDGDGDLDIYICSEAGNKMIFQIAPEPAEEGEEAAPFDFADATEYVGLAGVAGRNCSFADVNADGRADLLAGATIYLAGAELKGRFKPSKLLPAEAGKDLKTAAFAELNGDGYPDVVVSIKGGGLRAYLNGGAKGGPFRDVTKAMGLARKEAGAGGDGFFAVGDWNDDGRADLFYAAAGGVLLVQDAAGVWQPLKLEHPLDFISGEEQAPGLTGAGCFLPLFSPDRMDLCIPTERNWVLLANRGGRPVDVSAYGGEITEGSYLHLATIAEDLNLDGYVDFYTVSRGANGLNRFIINRGYGLFMHASKNPHYTTVFDRGGAHDSGGLGVAAGDLDGDGAPDLLLGNPRGELTLLMNETLELRRPEERPLDDVKRLLNVRILNVRVTGRLGVLAARVTLADAGGRLVGRRDIGTNVATGCRGPDAATFAVRTPGKYKLTIRFADGATQHWLVDLTTEKRVTLHAARREAATRPAPPTGPAR